jgi:hypothetical protein
MNPRFKLFIFYEDIYEQQIHFKKERIIHDLSYSKD